MHRLIRPVVVALAAVLAAGVLGTAGPAWAGTADDSRVAATQPFKADSGDDCPYGHTEGTLDWYPVSAPPGRAAVLVTGALSDEPVPIDRARLCPDDEWLSFATFVAYRKDTLVDQARVQVDNDIVGLRVALAANQPGVDSVVVQVCRVPVNSVLRPMYCGEAQVYRPDGHGTTGR